MKWIIADHLSSVDGIGIIMLDGDEDDVKEYIVQYVKGLIKDDPDGFRGGTLSAADVQDLGSELCGYAFFADYDADIVAREIKSIVTYKGDAK